MRLNRFCVINPIFAVAVLAALAAGCGSSTPVQQPAQVSTANTTPQNGPGCVSSIELRQPGMRALGEDEVVDGASSVYRLVGATLVLSSTAAPAYVPTPVAPGQTAPTPPPVTPVQPGSPPAYLSYQLSAPAAPGAPAPGYGVRFVCQGGGNTIFADGTISMLIPESVDRSSGALVANQISFPVTSLGPIVPMVTPVTRVQSLEDYAMAVFGDYGFGNLEHGGPKYRFYRNPRSGIDLVIRAPQYTGMVPTTALSVSVHYEAELPRARAQSVPVKSSQ
jgi:hypothetical protein